MRVFVSPKRVIKNDVKFVAHSKRDLPIIPERINSFQCIQNISTFLTYLSYIFQQQAIKKKKTFLVVASINSSRTGATGSLYISRFVAFQHGPMVGPV